MCALLQGAPWVVSRAPVRRLRTRAGLQVVQPTRTRRPLGKRPPVPTRALDPNQGWSSAFGPDETTEGRRLKCLTGLDADTREGLPLDCARSSTAGAVVHGLQGLCAQRGPPPYVKRDKGPELMAQQVTAWRHAPHVETPFIAPGSPGQNGPNESFHGVFRDGCLNRGLLASVQEARRLIHTGLAADHDERPHGALAGLTPTAFAAPCGGQSQEAACGCLPLKLVALFWA
jgi:putative transposase